MECFQLPVSASAATDSAEEMANYTFAYCGGSGVSADEAERDAQIAKWGPWFGQLAVELANGCPVLDVGGTVDVYEAIAT